MAASDAKVVTITIECTSVEKGIVREALAKYIEIVRRKMNGESNPEIKRILLGELDMISVVRDKFGGS